MFRYIAFSIVCGLVFGVLDALINGNLFAQRLFSIYKPISKKAINVPIGLIIDIIYGFILTGVFLILYESLPGDSGLLKGLSFSVIVWIFRVLMYTITQWMMFNIPIKTLLYLLLSGLIEMAILGILLGVFIKS